LYDRSDDIDFYQFKTFKIYNLDVEYPPVFQPSNKGAAMLLAAIENEMKQRGFKVDKEDPDLILNVGVVIKEEVQTRETDIRDAPAYIGQRNYSWESEEIEIGKYTEGTVVLDIIQESDSELLWQAYVKEILSKKRKNNQKKIDKVVHRLFKRFPVKEDKELVKAQEALAVGE